MPSSGWLAIGAVLSAIAAIELGPFTSLLGTIAALAAWAAVEAMRNPRSMRRTLLIGVGSFAILGRLVLLPAAPASATIPEGAGPWPATVESVGSPRRGDQVATLTLDVDGQPRVAATLPRYPPIEPGQRVEVDGSVRPPPADDYGAYLVRTGIVGTLRSRTLEVVPDSAGPGRTLERLRRGSADALARVLPEPHAGLAAGILVGLRDRVDRSLATDFTTAGVSHVVAISGWNIAIVAASVAAVAGRMSRRRRSLVTILAIGLYVAFAGGSASVVRAAAMAGVVLLARESGRAGRAPAAVGWAATILLLVDPALVRDAGFQLSALATAGLIAWASPFADAIDRRTGGRLPRWLSEGLGISLAAQVATFPVVLAAFGRLAMISPVVNLAVVPVVAPAMASGLLALGAGILVVIGLPHPIGALLAFPAWLSLGAIIACVDVAAALPFASVTFEPPANLLAAGSAIGLIAALTLRGRTPGSMPARPRPSTTRSRTAPRGLIRAGTAVLVVVMIGAGVTVIRRPDGTARIVVLDVGQGDAVLVEGGRGGRILVDGGPDPDLLLRALDDRLLPWDRRLDAIVLTHPHEDHVAGLALLLARYRVARVFEAGMRGPGPGYGAWTAALGAKQLPRATLSTGDRLQVDAVRLDVLWPDPGSVPPEPPDSGTGINNVSIVFLGEVAGRRFLLTGDVEEAIDPRLLERGLPRLDLLKVAHHGSRTSSTAPLLDRVTPAIAVVSAGAGNPYGHPSRATLERLESRGARTYRTDTNGSVEIGLAGDRVTVRLGRSAEAPATTAEPARRARIARPSALPAFACAVPATVADPPARSSRLPPISWAIAGPAAANLDRRVDDRARAVGGRLPQGLAPTGAVGQSSCASRRRSRRLARPVPRLTDSGTSTTRLRAADTAPRAPRASTAAAWPPAGPRAASIARPAVRAQAGR